MRRLRAFALITACLMVSVACGARLSEDEISAGLGSGSGGAGGGGGALTSGDASGEATDVAGEIGAGGAAAGASGSGGAAAGGAAAGTGGGAANVAAPAGGNGGATDVGVTETEILLGNVSTLTGPVPGLFRGALLGTQAFVAYQNSKGGLFGRKLKVKAADDRLDGGQNRAQIAALSKEVFAFVGSFSVTDDGGAEELQRNGVPDVGYALSRPRQALANNFSPQPLPAGWRLGPLNYFKEKFGDAVTKKVAGFYTDVASARDAYTGQKKAAEASGWAYVYERALSTAESNYTSDALQMRNSGAQAIFMATDVTNMARMAKAVEQQGVSLKLPNYGANAYDPKFIQLAGSAAEGALIDQQLNLYLGEDRQQIPEIDLFLTWMKKVAPDVNADIFAAFSWASARLFLQALEAGGAKATRAGLTAELKKIDNFDANGMIAPSGPASKRPPNCFVVIKVQGGKFVRADPPKGMICDKGDYYRIPQ